MIKGGIIFRPLFLGTHLLHIDEQIYKPDKSHF